MKKFFAAVCCCAVVSLNLSAQEASKINGGVVLAEAQSIIEAPDSESTLVSVFQDEKPAPVETPIVEAPEVTNDAVTETLISDGQIIEGQYSEGLVVGGESVVTEGYLPSELSGQYSEQMFNAAPAGAGCGGASVAPQMGFDAGTSYAGAPACDACAAQTVATDCGCETARTRPQVVSRVRGGFTSVRGRVGSIRGRRNACCN